MSKKQLTRRRRAKIKKDKLREKRILERIKTAKELNNQKKKIIQHTQEEKPIKREKIGSKFKPIPIKYPKIEFSSNWSLFLKQTPYIYKSGVKLPSKLKEIELNLTNVDKRSALWCFYYERVPPLKRLNPLVKFSMTRSNLSQKPGMYAHIDSSKVFISGPTFNYHTLKKRFCSRIGTSTWSSFPPRPINKTTSTVLKILGKKSNLLLEHPFSPRFLL